MICRLRQLEKRRGTFVRMSHFYYCLLQMFVTALKVARRQGLAKQQAIESGLEFLFGDSGPGEAFCFLKDAFAVELGGWCGREGEYAEQTVFATNLEMLDPHQVRHGQSADGHGFGTVADEHALPAKWFGAVAVGQACVHLQLGPSSHRGFGAAHPEAGAQPFDVVEIRQALGDSHRALARLNDETRCRKSERTCERQLGNGFQTM